MDSHERLEELIAADALGGLDRADREEMVRRMGDHGDDCAECLRLVSDYSEVAGRLAMSLDPVALSSGSGEQLLRAARAGDDSDEARGSEPRRPVRLGRGSRWTAAIAVAAAVAVLAGVVGYAIAPRGAEREDFLTFLAARSTRIVPLEGEPGRHLAVALRPGQTSAWLMGANLPPPEEGRVYELWFRQTGTAAMRPAGTFVPTGGTVLQRTVVGTEVELLAVTIEDEGGSDVPTSDPIFVSTG